MVSAESTSSQGHWTLAVATLRGQPLWTFDTCDPSGNPSIMDPMWIDDRGSEVLSLRECRRLQPSVPKNTGTGIWVFSRTGHRWSCPSTTPCTDQMSFFESVRGCSTRWKLAHRERSTRARLPRHRDLIVAPTSRRIGILARSDRGPAEDARVAYRGVDEAMGPRASAPSCPACRPAAATRRGECPAIGVGPRCPRDPVEES
jgi:hypothetical protein